VWVAWPAWRRRGPCRRRADARAQSNVLANVLSQRNLRAKAANGGFHPGKRKPRCRYSKSAHMDGLWHSRSGRSQSQHRTSTHECRIYYRRANRWDIVQQNQMPIHRKTPDRLAALENPKKHRKPRSNAQKPADGRKESTTHPTPCWQRQSHDTGAGGLRRDEIRSAGNSRRVDHSVCRTGSVARDVHRRKSMLAHIRRQRPR
jgi:hypothetical protein